MPQLNVFLELGGLIIAWVPVSPPLFLGCLDPNSPTYCTRRENSIMQGLIDLTFYASL